MSIFQVNLDYLVFIPAAPGFIPTAVLEENPLGISDIFHQTPEGRGIAALC